MFKRNKKNKQPENTFKVHSEYDETNTENPKETQPLFSTDSHQEEDQDLIGMPSLSLDTSQVKDSKPQKPKSRVKSLILNIALYGGIFVIAIVVFALLGGKDEEAIPDQIPVENPDTSSETTDEPKDDPNGDTDSNSTEKPNITEKPGTDHEGDSDEGAGEDSTDQNKKDEEKDGYAQYTNGYLSLTLEYPKDWISYERTQEGFDAFRETATDEILDIATLDLTSEVPISDFYFEANTLPLIQLIVYPGTNQEAASNQIIEDLFKPMTDIKPTITVQPHTKTMGTKEVNYMNYEYEEFGREHKVTQVTYKVGKNIILLHLNEVKPPELLEPENTGKEDDEPDEPQPQQGFSVLQSIIEYMVASIETK